MAPVHRAGAVDFASQMKEITVLHESGSLTPDEFQAAKAKLLDTRVAGGRR